MIQSPVYLDYHSTTPVDERVLKAMMPFFSQHFGNAASLHHRFGWIAKEAVDNARAKIASAIGAQPREIIFTSGATESNNLALKGAAQQLREKGNHIITTQIEHKCVLESCKKLEASGFEVTYLPVDRFGAVGVEDVRKAITPKTILVSVMSANNEIGTVQPMEEIATICTERGIVFHTDATQAIGRMAIDVNAMNIHLLSFASHKIYGPKGIGALYVRLKNPRVAIESQIDGAGHEYGMRSGTVNVPAIVGFGKAVQLVHDEMETENKRIARLRDILQDRLEKVEGAVVNGLVTKRLPHNLSVTFRGVSAEQLMNEINDIAVSAGAACASEEKNEMKYSHVLRAIGLDNDSIAGTIRIGLGRFTTEEEILYAADKIVSSVQTLRTFSFEGVS